MIRSPGSWPTDGGAGFGIIPCRSGAAEAELVEVVRAEVTLLPGLGLGEELAPHPANSSTTPAIDATGRLAQRPVVGTAMLHFRSIRRPGPNPRRVFLGRTTDCRPRSICVELTETGTFQLMDPSLVRPAGSCPLPSRQDRTSRERTYLNWPWMDRTVPATTARNRRRTGGLAVVGPLACQHDPGRITYDLRRAQRCTPSPNRAPSHSTVAPPTGRTSTPRDRTEVGGLHSRRRWARIT